MDIGYKIAFTYVILFICTIFSFGLPILFPIGAIYFSVAFWCDKLYNLRFYLKTHEFDQSLPI